MCSAEDKVVEAATLYLLRKGYNEYRFNRAWAKRWNAKHPDISVSPQGHWTYAGYKPPSERGFHPDPNKEWRSCCERVKFSYQSHWHHCCTATHVAELMGVNRTEVLREAKKLRVLEVLEQL